MPVLQCIFNDNSRTLYDFWNVCSRAYKVIMGAHHSSATKDNRHNSAPSTSCNTGSPGGGELDSEPNSKHKIGSRFAAARQRTTIRFRRFLSIRRQREPRKRTEETLERKESNLHKPSTSQVSGTGDSEHGRPERMEEISVEANITDHSPYAVGLARAWRRSLKECNVVKDKNQDKDHLDPATRAPFRPKSSGGGSEDLTHDVLIHIIRCFPFPSPRPSPRTSPQLSTKSPEREPLKRSKSATSRATQFFSKINNNNNNNNNSKAKVDGAVSTSQRGHSVSSLQTALRNMAMNSVDTMAITALPLDCWLRERLKHWVQLSGHQGTIVPASDCTLWKKRSGTDCNEATSYRKLMNDALCPFVPKFSKEVEYKGESFIEIEDLTSHFVDPAIMDIKIGTRTFLESEVKNPVSRKDLYQKMVKIDPGEPSEWEHAEQAVTKLRYMQFRERESSTAHLGFRVEAMKRPGFNLDRSFQKVKTRDQVMDVLCKFMGGKAPVVRGKLLDRLKAIRNKVEISEFFRTHEVIGSSLLFMFDDKFASVWMIDFAKALPVDNGISLDHKSPWHLGNHEDGYLTGLDHLIQILEDSKHKELSTLNI